MSKWSNEWVIYQLYNGDLLFVDMVTMNALCQIELMNEWVNDWTSEQFTSYIMVIYYLLTWWRWLLCSSSIWWTCDCLYGMQIYILLHNIALVWFGVFQFSSLLLNASCVCVCVCSEEVGNTILDEITFNSNQILSTQPEYKLYWLPLLLYAFIFV